MEVISFKELEDYIQQKIEVVSHLVGLGVNSEAVEARYITLREVLDEINDLKIELNVTGRLDGTDKS